MSVEQLVDRMVEYHGGSVMLHASLNPRTGEAKSIEILCARGDVAKLREWLREFLMVAGDDIAQRYRLTERTPAGHKSEARSHKHPDQIFGDLRYSLPRGG